MEQTRATASAFGSTWLRLLLKIAVSVGLLAWVVRSLDLGSISERLTTANPIRVAAALAITLAIATLHAARWRIVVTANNARLSYLRALQLTLIGYFFNQTLPSTIGGDAFRIWGAYRARMRLTDAANSVILDRLVALAALLLMVAVMTPWLFEHVGTDASRGAILFLVAAGIGGFAALLGVDRLPAAFLRWRALRLVATLSAYGRRVLLVPRYSVPTVALTVLAHCVAAATMYILATAIDVNVSLFHCVLLFPLVMIVSIIPVSIAGWGVREGAMVVALSLVGVAPTEAFSLSVLYGLVNVAAGVPGGILWLARARTSAPQVSSGAGTLNSYR
jgi:uncharacterized membrane protein YbhN (UPF0104 family)